MSHKRNLKVTLALSATIIAAAFAPSAQAAEVCNEARESQPGNYTATDNDPNPPARHKTGLSPIGDSAGLNHAAERSPVLSRCSQLVRPPDVIFPV